MFQNIRWDDLAQNQKEEEMDGWDFRRGKELSPSFECA
jgi:hypothetical protein